jgi:exonuclease VII large subunit
MERAKQAFFYARESRLAAAQLALASLPRRLPSSAEAARLDSQLDARAQAFFRARAEALASESRRMEACERTLGRTAERVVELSRQLEVGIRRQLADHARDYGRALIRLVREARVGAARRIGDTHRNVAHLAAMVEARDFRRRGWVVVTDQQGGAVSTVSRLAAGARLRFTLGDGRADAIVDQVFRDGKETE